MAFRRLLAPVGPRRRHQLVVRDQFLLLAIREALRQAGRVGSIGGVAVGAGPGLAAWPAGRPAVVVRAAPALMAGYTRIGGSPDAGLTTITLPQATGL